MPHDLGSPTEQPWFQPNVYNFQDVSKWKDLGPKFVLQIFRDYTFIKNSDKNSQDSLKFLRDMYDVCVNVMAHCHQYIDKDDGMIRNEGFPDQVRLKFHFIFSILFK